MGIIRHLVDVIKGKAKLGHPRSPKWPAFEKEWLKTHDTCDGCGGREKLEVHHKEPYHLNPARELDPTNVKTLCESKKHGINCHLLLGHRGNYKKYNEDVDKDARIWKEKINGA